MSKTKRMNAAHQCLALALGLLLSGGLHAASGPLLSQQQIRQAPEHAVSPSPAGTSLAPSTALEYAQDVAVDIDSHRHGRWLQEGEQAVWRLMLRSEEARSLSVTLDDMQLPASAALRLYDGDGLLWHGPHDAAELQRHPQFWSAIVPGERLLLELSVPLLARDDTHLAIRAVQHGFHDIRRGFKSGSCNIDTACPAADAWTDAVRAAAMITIANRRICSAVLLNNSRQNGDPLLLTARHCGVGQDDLPASSVRVYWNYETSGCGSSPDGSLSQNQLGSTLLAEGAAADFSLLRLDRTPPAFYQVYYAGWDATGLAPTSGVSVHHPSGDEKRISFFDTPARARTANVDGQPVESWEVRWRRGITESGSSGGGLWNSDHRVIGQLSGGNSSCDNPDGADVYGRLDVAWEESPRLDGQLKAWLDPDNTGVRRLDGRDSSGGGLNANADSFSALPADSQELRLDVLANDGGSQPLRLTGALADSGQVRVENGHLVYRFAPGVQHDTLSYQVVDRWGNVASVAVSVSREGLVQGMAQQRGGALAPWLLLLLAGVRCRRRG